MPEPRLKDTALDHRKKADRLRTNVAVITLSNSRSAKDDESGDMIQKLLEESGHSVGIRKLIADNRTVLRATLRELSRQKDVNVIITTGGTGISSTDITIETVKGMLEKELPGFNSLFMLLSFPQAKSASMLSRALAGTLKGKAVFCLPGSPRACKLATEALILPELRHMIMLLGS
ncbi:MAG: MogA/MoaB family molybdenum cofactor biosynthesis protein [Acidobacteriia bacterium]|nr:MogA/MoaB family molybdenum cofactor biosynthesis protein [Terriglobia bacterium]